MICWLLDDNHNTVPTSDVLAWARMYQDHSNRIVAKTQIGDVRVSTMFIGIDQRYSDSDTPMLFETMIFGGAHNEEFWRCSTWSEAEAQHREACALVMV